MPLTIGALKYAVGHYPDDVRQAVAESEDMHGYYAHYHGDGFLLTVDLTQTDLVYLHLMNPDERYRVLTGPLREFAAMLAEYHLTNREEN